MEINNDITPLFDMQTLSLNAETTAEYVIVDSVDVRNSMDPCPDTQSLNKMVEDNTPETSNEQKYTTDKISFAHNGLGRISRVLSRFPWNTDTIVSRTSLTSLFPKNHWTHNFMKSVEAYENTLKNSTDKDTMTLKRIILIDTNYDERNNIVDEDEILSVETLNLQARNNTTRNLCALITNYRIADIVASIEKHEIVIEVPCHKKEHVIGAILHKQWDKVEDWAGTIDKFKTVFKQQTTFEDDYIPNDLSLRAQFLKNLCNLAASTSIVKIKSNLQLAAFHLSYLINVDFNGDLPDIPSDSYIFLTGNNNYDATNLTDDEKSYISNFAKNCPIHQMRLPLQAALLISPIILLSTIQLHKFSWDRRNMLMCSKALGNQKPKSVTNIENCLWEGLFGLSRGHINLSGLVKNLSTHLRNFDKNTISEEDLNFFTSDNLLNVNDQTILKRTLISVNTNGLIHNDWPMPWKSRNTTDVMDVDDNIVSDLSNTISKTTIKNCEIIHSDEETEEEQKRKHHSPITTSSEIESDNDNNRKSSTTFSVSMDTTLDQLNDTADTLITRKSSRLAELQSQSVDYHPPSISKKKKRKPQSQSNQKRNVVKNDALALALSRLKECRLYLRPIVIEDIEADEIINLNVKNDNPRLTSFKDTGGKQRNKFTMYDINGEPIDYQPSMHSEKDLAMLYRFVDGVENTYVQHVPYHMQDNESSMMYKIDHDTFSKLSVERIQEIIEGHHMILVNCQEPILNFDVQGLMQLKSLFAVISIQDHSIDIAKHRFKDGTLNHIIECTTTNGGPILSTSYLPMSRAHVEMENFASDLYAWNETEGLPYCKNSEKFPTVDIRWAYVSLKGAFSSWKMSPDGFGTFFNIRSGAIWLLFARPSGTHPTTKGRDPDLNWFSNCGLFLKKFNPTESGEEIWDIEAVYVSSGNRIVLRPNTPYTMLTAENSICHGGYFYAFSTIRQTMYAIVHVFVGDKIPSSHIPTSRYLLQRMLFFCHEVYIIRGYKTGAIDTPHVPNLKTILSFLDLLTLCYLVIASNFLDPRTYQYPSTKTNRIPSDDYIKKMKIFDLNDMDAVDRRRCSYARGLAWKITRWCEDNFEIYRTTPTNQVSIHALINTYFATLSKKILAYKSRAQSAKITGVPNCTHELLQQQMMYCFERTEVKAYFDQTPINFENIEDLDYRLPFNYHIRRRDPTTVKNRTSNTNPFIDGTTIGDEQYWKGYNCGFELPVDVYNESDDQYRMLKRKRASQV